MTRREALALAGDMIKRGGDITLSKWGGRPLSTAELAAVLLEESKAS